MENHFFIGIDNGGLLYQLFYLAAFLVAYAILLYEGYRRKFPMLSWVLILASIRIAVVIGTKVFSYTSGEWAYMFENHLFLPNDQKTMFGGFLLGVLTWLVISRLLRFRFPAWDAVAYVIPAAVAVQSLGCFFYGCCYGTPSSLPWAVQYPVMSLAHFHQFQSGLISYGNSNSLPVHPVQLYETLGAIAVFILVYAFRKRWKASGSLFLSSLLLFSLVRFAIEFFRDPLSNKSGGEMIWLLKGVQWQYLAFAALVTIGLIVREKTWRPQAAKAEPSQPLPGSRALLLVLLVIVLWLIRFWLTVPEIIAVNIALLPAVYLSGREVLRNFQPVKVKLAYMSLLILPLFLMSQTIPQTMIDSSSVKRYNTYHTVGGGFSTGHYTVERTSFTGSGCDRVTDENYFEQKYNAGAVGYTFTKMLPDRSRIITFGGGLTLGRFNEIDLTHGGVTDFLLVDAGGFAKYDEKWFGIGASLHMGKLAYSRGDAHRSDAITSSSVYESFIFPGMYFRIGPQKYLFADIHIADNYLAAAPGLDFMLGLGSGLGLNNGTTFRIGTSFIDNNTWYISGYLPLADQIVIEPVFMWSGRNDYYPSDLPENQFSLGLSYRFGHK